MAALIMLLCHPEENRVLKALLLNPEEGLQLVLVQPKPLSYLVAQPHVLQDLTGTFLF